MKRIRVAAFESLMIVCEVDAGSVLLRLLVVALVTYFRIVCASCEVDNRAMFHGHLVVKSEFYLH